MTALSKDEVLRMWSKCMRETPGTALPIDEFATLCRADLVAEVERLKAACDKYSEAEMLCKHKGYVFP